MARYRRNGEFMADVFVHAALVAPACLVNHGLHSTTRTLTPPATAGEHGIDLPRPVYSARFDCATLEDKIVRPHLPVLSSAPLTGRSPPLVSHLPHRLNHRIASDDG
ncbi:hypothetical protein K488DRAFT_92779 [Vararia minispora EC-137]|uniref:Uncharacterized protein n=1 Tax=Vararia minispora EC-137 TaxID=1314806 RepID=A0ACB8Q427_9AGAM|nr:hypothetical protein K488DRAFT_92779 [Vararia minispora EC-137]